jgi:hypothetical protein
MIQSENKQNLDAFHNMGGWIGDIAFKSKNLVRLYENQEMPEPALTHMLTEMMKMTSVTATPDEIIKKDDLNGVLTAIIADAQAAYTT